MQRNLNRIFVENQLIINSYIELESDYYHYLINVLRLKIGHLINIFNGIDGEFIAVVDGHTKKSVKLKLIEKKLEQKTDSELILIFALIKPARLELLIEKATELGVSKFMPITTERTIIHKCNLVKLRRTAIEAAEQCERLTIPIFLPLISLKELIQSWPEDQELILADETGGGQLLTKTLNDLHNKTSHAIMVGPEGGFSPDEISLCGKYNYIKKVQLGPRILRAETAAIALLANVQSIVGDWQIGPRKNIRDNLDESNYCKT